MSVSRWRRVAAVLPLLSLAACGDNWFTDFKRQPSVVTWESLRSDSVAVRGNPQMSVPTTGTFMAGFQVSYMGLPSTLDSMSVLANPTPPNEASLVNGRKYYQINCAVCHGDKAMGDGKAVKYGMFAPNLTADATKARSDGYLYAIIRNGRGIMPSYNRIEEMDRWDVVNYVRGLQGRLGAAVPTGPVGQPGETGTKLPGMTRMAPTRSSQYLPSQPAAPRDSTARPGAAR
jgi:mono/diheme cytochrome c family protein